jgi:hypothetical protein
MAVGRRKPRKERESLIAAVADPAPDYDPIMILIMGLFEPTPMPNDRISQARRALSVDTVFTHGRPIYAWIDFLVWGKKNHAGALPLWKCEPRLNHSLLTQSQLKKEAKQTEITYQRAIQEIK